MLTILEGPDGGGKTTFAEWLFRRHNHLTSHHGPYPASERIAAHYWLDMPIGNSPRVFDRSWLSEAIYAEAWRKQPSRLRVYERRMLERIALSKQVVVAKIQPPFELCVAQWSARKKSEYVQNAHAFEHVYGLYQELRTDLPIVTLDDVEPDYPSWLELLDETRAAFNPSPGIGNPQASTLLVGDRVSAGRWQNDWPFCADSGCSPWLAEVLEEAGIPESRLYWANAVSSTGQPLEFDWIERHNFARIIALGNVAFNALGDFCPSRIPHPQFHRRFRSSEPYELIEILKGA